MKNVFGKGIDSLVGHQHTFGDLKFDVDDENLSEGSELVISAKNISKFDET